MPDDAIHYADSFPPRVGHARSVPCSIRLSVLSASLTRRPKHRTAAIFATAAVHGLVLTALLVGMHAPQDHEEAATVEIITVPAPQPVEPDPQPPTAPPASEPSADPLTPTETVAPPAPQDPAPAELVIPQSEPADPPRPAAEPPAQTEIHRLPPKPATLRAAPPRPAARTTNPATPARSDTSDKPPQQTQATGTLKARIRDAVQAAARCPAAARMMSLSGTVGVAFDYLDGAMIGAPMLTRTSGAPILDTAALNAVRDAHYPAAPPEASAQPLHLLVWVEEACSG